MRLEGGLILVDFVLPPPSQRSRRLAVQILPKGHRCDLPTGWSILHRLIEQEGTCFQVCAYEAEMDKRAAEIERFVRQHNIEHYRKLLGEPTDPLRRQQLEMLLTELEATQQ